MPGHVHIYHIRPIRIQPIRLWWREHLLKSTVIGYSDKLTAFLYIDETPHAFSRYFLGHAKDALKGVHWSDPDLIYS